MNFSCTDLKSPIWVDPNSKVHRVDSNVELISNHDVQCMLSRKKGIVGRKNKLYKCMHFIRHMRSSTFESKSLRSRFSHVDHSRT